MLRTRVFLAAAASAVVAIGNAQDASVATNPLQPAQLRTLLRHLPEVSYYPEFAKIRHLEGRLLIEFRIDASGNTMDAKIVRSDADVILQATALRLVRGTRYELGSRDVNPTTVFRTTVVYCLDHCDSAAAYPDSDSSVQISGGDIPMLKTTKTSRSAHHPMPPA
ncbi:MAG TPA: energy transducer TonB [Steroidobacteraceae bacterium]|nr:energy transducer TonB [Steroidobacteraceae bacterium]